MTDISDELIELEGWLMGKGYSRKARVCLQLADKVEKIEAEVEALRKRLSINDKEQCRLQATK